MPGVSLTAWMYFAAAQIDPLWDILADGQYRPFKIYLPMVRKA